MKKDNTNKKDTTNSLVKTGKVKKDNANKKDKANFFVKIGRWFAKTGKALAKYFKEVTGEVKKLSWPTKKELINYTLAVIAFVALMAVIMWVLDLGFSNGIKLLASIGR